MKNKSKNTPLKRKNPYGSSRPPYISVGVITGIGRKWNRSDSSDSDSVELMTPLATPIFDFH